MELAEVMKQLDESSKAFRRGLQDNVQAEVLKVKEDMR